MKLPSILGEAGSRKRSRLAIGAVGLLAMVLDKEAQAETCFVEGAPNTASPR